MILDPELRGVFLVLPTLSVLQSPPLPLALNTKLSCDVLRVSFILSFPFLQSQHETHDSGLRGLCLPPLLVLRRLPHAECVPLVSCPFAFPSTDILAKTSPFTPAGRRATCIWEPPWCTPTLRLPQAAIRAPCWFQALDQPTDGRQRESHSSPPTSFHTPSHTTGRFASHAPGPSNPSTTLRHSSPITRAWPSSRSTVARAPSSPTRGV